MVIALLSHKNRWGKSLDSRIHELDKRLSNTNKWITKLAGLGEFP